MSSQIVFIEDLEDHLNILENVVMELRKEAITRSELQMLLNQYILLEDSILIGIKYLSGTIVSIEEKNDLDLHTESFNALGSDFQDTWAEEYWECYESIREGFKHGKKHELSTNESIENLKELAIALTRNTSEGKKEESRVLEEVDELSRKYKPSTSVDPVQHKCCNCRVF